MLNSCFLGSVARTDAEYVNHKTNWTATDKRVVGRTLSFFQPVFETGFYTDKRGLFRVNSPSLIAVGASQFMLANSAGASPEVIA
jgi:hypothetical protein